MNYDYFLGMVKNHETDLIRAFRGQGSSNPQRVPDAFALLIPEIINILDHNIARICSDDAGMMIFGLQPASSMIASDQPKLLNRQITGFQSDYHFCCTLDYLTAPKDQLMQIEQWDRTHSIIVDFTSGNIMDTDYYYAQLFDKPTVGELYGVIDDETLQIAWTIVDFKQKQQIKNKQQSIKNFMPSRVQNLFEECSVA